MSSKATDKWVGVSYKHRGVRYFLRVGFPQSRTYKWLPSVMWGHVGPTEEKPE